MHTRTVSGIPIVDDDDRIAGVGPQRGTDHDRACDRSSGQPSSLIRKRRGASAQNLDS